MTTQIELGKTLTKKEIHTLTCFASYVYEYADDVHYLRLNGEWGEYVKDCEKKHAKHMKKTSKQIAIILEKVGIWERGE